MPSLENFKREVKQILSVEQKFIFFRNSTEFRAMIQALGYKGSEINYSDFFINTLEGDVQLVSPSGELHMILNLKVTNSFGGRSPVFPNGFWNSPKFIVTFERGSNSVTLTNESYKPRNYNTDSELDGDHGTYSCIECKNWKKAVGSKEIRDFVGKMEACRVTLGFYLSKNGITGETDGQNANWEIRQAFVRSGIIIVVITLAELKSMKNFKSEFIELLTYNSERVKFQIKGRRIKSIES